MAIKLFKVLEEYRTSGFGSKVEDQPERLLNQDGSVNVRKAGLGWFDHFSIFHYLVTTNWWIFNALVVISFLLINIFFGFIYYFLGIENLYLHAHFFLKDLLEAVYFSAQTFSTVGYGRVNPISDATNIVALIEMLVGMMYLALATGLLFARFSRPVSKIVFSSNTLIAPYKEGTGLMFRFANAKSNLLLEVSVQFLLNLEIETDGKKERKFFRLPLEFEKINLLALSWTVVHPIDKNSPLFQMTKAEFDKTNAELVVLVHGINDTFSQNIHARTSYKFYDVVWNAKFERIFKNSNGKTILELDRIGDYQSLP